MCTSLLKTLNIEYASNPCVERVLALGGGGVTLYSKGFQSCSQINCHSTELGTFPSPLGEVAVVLAEQATNNQTSPLLRERIEHSMRSIASVLGEGTNQTIAILRALSSERRKSGGKLWYQ